MGTTARRVLLALVTSAVTIVGAERSGATATEGVVARFEGRTIRLADGWGPARACVVHAGGTDCFRTEREMDRFLERRQGGRATPRASCSTTLRLYDGTVYTGQSLGIATRGIWINLDAYGFDARTSSYKIGACSAWFTDGRNGSGAWYPGTTSAYTQSTAMSTGWNNRIRSVYIA